MKEKKHQEQQILKNKDKFKRIILYARQHRANQGVSESLSRLIDFLEKQEVQVYQDIDTASGFDVKMPVLAREEMGKKNDLIIVVGGDGSLLSAARMAIKVNTPVIGINRGRLGFLTDILPHELETQMDAVLRGIMRKRNAFFYMPAFMMKTMSILRVMRSMMWFWDVERKHISLNFQSVLMNNWSAITAPTV